jgi:rRNA maturation RNase YbeY
MTIGGEIVNRQRDHRVDTRALGRFVTRLARTLPPPSGDRVAVCLVSDAEMVRLQSRFRRRRGTTDVLSFPGGGAADPTGEVHLGDIAISVAQAARQAGGPGRTLDRELERLVLHGYLHLLGYDHERDDGRMAILERRLARSLVRRTSRGRRVTG